jgi:uncharacterized Zn finger protein (UPF0148 family)
MNVEGVPLDKDMRNKINWIIDFVQEDLDRLSEGDRAKLVIETRENLSPPETITGMAMPESIREKGGYIPKPPSPGTEEYWNELKRLQTYLRGKIHGLMELAPGGNRVSEIFDNCFMNMNVSKKTYMFSIIPFPTQHDHYALFVFFNLINGAPAGSLKKCESCGRIFFASGHKAKIFCSTKCQWRANAKKARETDPEKYRQKQREIMRKKYERERLERKENEMFAYVEAAQKHEKAIRDRRADGADLRTED